MGRNVRGRNKIRTNRAGRIIGDETSRTKMNGHLFCDLLDPFKHFEDYFPHAEIVIF
jgi:hypothetical protein